MDRLTRRTFLAKLSTVMVVAPIAPKLLGSIEATLDAPTSQSVPSFDYPQLNVRMLEESYQVCCWGYEEPDLMVMAPDVYAEFMCLFVTWKDSQRFLTTENDVTCPYFNGAAVTWAKALPRGSWLCINSDNEARRKSMKRGLGPVPPSQELLSGYFSKHALTRRDIPTELG